MCEKKKNSNLRKVMHMQACCNSHLCNTFFFFLHDLELDTTASFLMSVVTYFL